MNEHIEAQSPREIKEIEVPLANRLAHLGIDDTIETPRLTAQQIARTLGIDGNLVRRPLRKYEVEAEQHFSETQQEFLDYYPQYALELIREERAWRAWYVTLPLRVNTNQVAEAVGRSYGWTAKTLEELYPTVRQQRVGYRSRLYPRTAVQKLRDITFATPPDENWPTLPRLIEFTGHDRTWVLNRIEQTTIRPEMRRQAVSGREFPHYPPDTFEVLQEFMEIAPAPAGNWLTVHAIAEVLGKSGNWVTRRIEARYLANGEPRLDDMGVERMHYPPETMEVLRQEADNLAEHEVAGDWATISTLEARLGTHAVTLTRLMQQIEVESEMRIDLRGRLKPHFSPDTQVKLAKKVLEVYGYPEADDWVTFSVAMKIIGRSAGWIRQQFSQRGVTPETRLDASRHPLEHFDINRIQEIKQYADTLDAGSMVSVNEMIERTGKSRIWVTNRLVSLGAVPEKRFSQSGKLIDHYEESVIDELLSQLDRFPT